MNVKDEINSVRRLRSTHTSLESWDLSNDYERLPPKARPLNHSMSDGVSRFELRLVEESSETTCSPWVRKKVWRGIVWYAAYGARLTHPERSAVTPQSSNHSEHVVVSSSPMRPYTH
jgi:hypothetical protein